MGVRALGGRDGGFARVASRWLLPAAGAVAAVLGSASHAAAAPFFTAEPTSPQVVNTALTWTFAPTANAECDLSSDVAATVTSTCDQGSYTFTPTTAGHYTLTVVDPATPDTPLGTSGPIEVDPAQPDVTRGGTPTAPTWSFTAPADATVTCTLTDGATTVQTDATCASPWTTDLSAQPYGDYTAHVTVTENGLASAPGTADYAYRPPAPGVTLTAPTTQPSNQTGARFALTDNAAGSGHTFTCWVTGPGTYQTPPATCTDPVDVALGTAPSDGRYTLHVTETADGVDSAEGIATYDYDGSISPVGLTLAPAAGSSRTITGSVSEPDGDIAGYSCTVAGVSATVTTCDGSSISLVLPDTATDGDYDVTITATDRAGNSASTTKTYTLDTTGPTTAPTATAKPGATGSSTSPTWTLAPTEPGEKFSCGASTAGSTATCSGDTVSLAISGPDGSYSVSVTPLDQYGNAGTTFTLTYVLDRAITPVGLTLAPTAGSSRTVTGTVSEPDTDGVSFACSVDGVAAVVVNTCTATSISLDLPDGLADGSYTVTVTATDAAGNTTSAMAAYLLDTTGPTTAPAATVTPGPRGRSTAPSWSLTPTETGETFICGGSTAGSAATCSGSTVSLSISGTDGSYSVTVIPADRYGNSGAPFTLTYVLDRTITPVGLTLAPTAGSSRTITGTVSEPDTDGVTYSCSVVGVAATVSVCTSSAVTVTLLTGAADGSYTVTVTATDAAGNSTTDTGDYLLDTAGPATAPSASVTPGPRGRSTTPSWSLTPTETGETFTCGATTPGSTATCSSNTVSLSITGTDGSYSVTVTPVDRFGNAGTPFALTYVLDRAITPVRLTLAPTAGSSPTITGTVSEPDTDGVTYSCSVVGVAATVSVCTSSAVTVTLPAGVADGSYTVQVTATDAAGNATTDTAAYLLDTTGPTTAPAASLTPGSPGSSATPSWTLTPTETGETFTCGATTTGSTATCSGTTVSLSITGTDGSYSVTVTPVDRYGNAGTPFTLTYTFDTTPPASPALTTGAPASTGQPLQKSWTVSDATPADLDHYTCVLTAPAGAVAGVTCDATTGQVVLTITSGPDGDYAVAVAAVDTAGNVSAPLPLDYVLDRTPPAAPTLTPKQSSPGSGSSAAWALSGVENGATVTCAATNSSGAAVPDARIGCGGTVTLNLSGLPDDTYTVTVTVTDAAGNASAAAASYTFDTQPPAAPTITADQPTPNNVRNPSWTLTGIETGAVLSCTATGPAGALDPSLIGCYPNLTLDLRGLADGSYTVTVTLTDAANNKTVAPLINYYLDTVAPVPPALTLSPGPTGNNPTPSWSLSGGEVGAKISCAITGPNGAVADTLVTCGSGTVSVNLAGLPDGPYTLVVTATDAAGNSAPSAPSTYTYDTVPPAAPTVTPSLNTTGSDRSPSWTVTGVENAALIECAVTRPDSTALDPTRVGCGSTVTLNLANLADGAYTLTVTVVDAAGNRSAPVTRIYTLDTVAPAAPTVTANQTSPNHLLTATWSVSGVETGATESCAATDAAGNPVAGITRCDSTVTLDLSALADGTYLVTVTVTDAAGNSTSAPAVAYTLDTHAPAAPAVTLVTASPGNGRTVSWSVNGIEQGAQESCTVTGPNGKLTAGVTCGTTVTADLANQPDGGYTLVVTITDAAGNSTPSAPSTYTLDTTAPLAPTVTPVPGVGTTGTTGYSRNPTWDVTHVETGAAISCTVTGPNGVLTSGVTCGSTVTVDLTNQPDGTYQLVVTLTDAAFNSTDAAPVTYVLDTVAPAAPTVTPVPGPGTTGTTGYSRSPSWSVTGIEPAALETCTVTGPGNVTVADTRIGCGSTVTLDLTGLADGSYSLTVTLTDAAGNSVTTAPVAYILDTVAPAAATVRAVPGIGSTGSTGYSTTPTWSISNVETGAKVSCAATGPSGAVPAGDVTCTSSSATLSLAGLPDGTYSLVVTVTDAAGNATSSAAVRYLLDRVPPATPTLASGVPAATGNQFGYGWTVQDSDPQFASYVCSPYGPSGSTPSVTCTPAGVVTLSIGTGSPDGSYEVDVYAVDAAGNVSTNPLVLTYLLDTVAPPAAVVTPQRGPGTTGTTGYSRSPSWAVTNVETGATITCAATGPAGAVAAGAVHCGPTTTLDLTGLADGTYTLVVTVTDAAGNATPSAPVTYILDTVAPVAPTVTAVAGPGTTGTTGYSRTPTWSLTNVEPNATLTCTVTGPGGAVGQNAITCGSTVVVDLRGGADGTYSLVVTVTDAAGNATSTQPVTYVLDTVPPPTPSVTGGTATPFNTRSPAWSLQDGDPTVTYTCSVTGPAGAVATAACTSGNSVSLSIGATSPDGTYTITVQAVDPAGNVDTRPLVFTYVLDTTGPRQPSATTVASPGNSRTVTWTLTGTEAGEYYGCSATGGATVTCAGSTLTLSVPGLPDGPYTVTVTPFDVLGNAGTPLTLQYVLDTTGPVAPGSTTVESPGNSRNISWSLFGTESPETYSCALTTGAGATVSCSGTTVSLSLGGAADGTYTVTVTPYDALHNAGTPLQLTYVLDTTGPVAPSASSVASPSNNRTATWSLTGTEAGETYSCSVAGASVACDPSSVTLSMTGSADGTYVVTVVPYDVLGNAGQPLALSYTLDTTGPVQPQVTAAPASPSTARSLSWTITDAESPVTYTCAGTGPVAFTFGCGTTVTATLPTSAPDGTYSIVVTPYDAVGNPGQPLTLGYVLDTTPPLAPVVNVVSPGNSRTPTLFVGTEPNASLTCQVQRYFLLVGTQACTSGTVNLTGQADGEFEITVWATDLAGNTGPGTTVTYLLDTVPPATPTLVSPASPSPITDPVWRWTSEDGTTATCTVTNALGVIVAGPSACSDVYAADFSAIPDGSYTLSVVLADTAGNKSKPATSLFILDRTAPVPPTVVPPKSPDNATAPRWLITAPRGATLTCTLLRGHSVLDGSGACPADGVFSLAGMPDGTYTLRVTATDSAGNVSAASVTTYVLDTVKPPAPSLAYSSGSAGTNRSPFWGFTLPGGTTGRCELLYGGDVVSARNNCRGAVSFGIGGPGGVYTLRVVAVDAAGNASPPLLVDYQLLAVGPGPASFSGGSSHPSGGAHRPPTPRTPLQRLLQQVSGAFNSTRSTVKHSASSVVNAIAPALPVIHDKVTQDVSHAVQNVVNAVSKAGGGTGFPLLLLVIVALFLMAQSRIDRRDPKLAFASVAADDNLQFGPPPSRGGDQ